MKKTFFILIIGIIIANGIGLLILQKISNSGNLTIEPIDPKGVFVGDRKLAPELEQGSEVQPKQLREHEEHDAGLRAIDEAAEYVRLGDRYASAGHHQEAAAAYKKAYSVGGGSRAVSGLLLAMTYERLGQCDEGISLIDEMIRKGYLSEQGIQNANEIRERLLVAKNQA